MNEQSNITTTIESSAEPTINPPPAQESGTSTHTSLRQSHIQTIELSPLINNQTLTYTYN